MIWDMLSNLSDKLNQQTRNATAAKYFHSTCTSEQNVLFILVDMNRMEQGNEMTHSENTLRTKAHVIFQSILVFTTSITELLAIQLDIFLFTKQIFILHSRARFRLASMFVSISLNK